MTYTAEDIIIHDPLEYTEKGLDIRYDIPGEDKPAHLLALSTTDLMNRLESTGLILDWNPVDNTARKDFNSSYLSFETFMKNNLNQGMAVTLVLHFLNNKTAKP